MNSKKMFLLAMVMVFAVILAISGCQGSSSADTGGEDMTVGHIVYTLEHQFHQSIAKEIVSYGKAIYNAKVIVLDGEASSEKALAAVENLISQNVDAISIHNPDMALTAESIQLAHAKDIPIVTTLIHPAEKIAPHVQPMETPAHFTMGKVAAEQWLAAHPDKPCKVAILDFGKFEQVEILRTDPFFEGVKSVDPNAELVTILNGQGSTDASMQITLDILQANPEVNIILGGNDEMGLGALAACEQIGRGKMDNGKPLTEIIAGCDANISAMIKIFDPNSSFKLSNGAVRDVARGAMDAMAGMIEGKIDMNKFQLIEVYVRPIDFWNTSIEDAQVFLQDNYDYTGVLADDVAAATK
jgi:ABC-type sugar transport system substrate-binding protein